MGSGLIEIKRRMKSIQNTKKITKAMGLVATSKLRKVRRELDVNNRYYNSLSYVTDELMTALGDFKESVYIKGNNSEQKLFIVLTSDSGLCGGFNSNVVAYLNNNFSDDKLNNLVMVVGQKGIPYVKKRGFDTVAEYVDIADVPTIRDARTITEHAIRKFKAGEVSEVNVVYTEFITTVKQEVRVDKLLPFEIKEGKQNLNYTIEPDIETVFDQGMEVYLKGKVLNAMINSKSSEQSARMQAMDGATKNADDILDRLTTKYNRIRQSAITQEISEIVGGAEAQK
ncbi:F-type H+-transporting ATPase subunit gamma [Clostridium cavendishii DSM 21758]|uniref:ATP synthase gamma chain n=1 Tax=Clostridium cavendishii DSM 21758 TaxID=1121302 RepID=A0A1M6U3L4_9CLOT|nr:ATP synthase F1 subunit gamma [Clostridium cavendishii]SHK63760.1 F-type H+-transporting ATPase subunit gamma [Clostridium cavendishii DSM 21758]